jgi:hypothetical protein
VNPQILQIAQRRTSPGVSCPDRCYPRHLSIAFRVYDSGMSRIPWHTILSHGADGMDRATRSLRIRRSPLGRLALLVLFVIVSLPLLALTLLGLLVIAAILGIMALLRIRAGQWFERWNPRSDARENVRVIRHDATA